MAEYDSDDQEQPQGMAPDDVRELFQGLRSSWSVRNSEYSRARRLYRGEHWNASENPAPRNRYSLTANYLKPIADKDVQILMGQLPGIQVPPPDADTGGRAFAERIEGLLYGNWRLNDAHKVFLNVAWNCTVLRRGIIYYWFDHKSGHTLFKSCTPENFYPLYDGDEIVEAIYVQRRLTRRLKNMYPQLSDQITSDEGMDHAYDTDGSWSQVQSGVTDALGSAGAGDDSEDHTLGYTTVIDWYDNEGKWVRLMGDAVHSQSLGYQTKDVPFLEVVNSIQGEEREPINSIDQIAELNMYYDILLSQRADVIKKWSNPPIIDRASGQSPVAIKMALGGDGGVLSINPRGDIGLLRFDGSMPEISEQMTEVKDALYDLSGKPRSAFGQTITNQSGVMTNLALTPTLQSNELRETLWGWALEKLNRRILENYETFRAEDDIHFRGLKQGKTPKNKVSFEVTMKGKDINGWYESRAKWPSAIRVDDPAFVQTELSKMTSDPQAQSIYDTLENLGVEDVEAYIDRIRAEREDPRIHPEVMEQTMNTLGQMSSMMMPPDMQGVGDAVMGGAGGGGAQPDAGGGDPAVFNQQMKDSGVPLTAGE